MSKLRETDITRTAEVLIVSDNQSDVQLLLSILENSAYSSIGVASTAMEAILMAARDKPDLVLIEMNLASEMDAIETSDRIYSDCHIPTVYLVTDVGEDLIECVCKKRPFGYVLKPIKKTELLIAIETSLNHHNVEKQFKESENRFRQLSSATSETIIIHKDGKILDTNESIFDMFGYNSSDVVDKNIFELFSPEFEKVIVTTIELSDDEKLEVLALRQDGSTFFAHIRSRLLKLDDKLINALTISDITKSKQTQKALRKSEKGYRLVVDNANEAIVIAQDGVLKFFNPKVLELTGYIEEELLNRPFLELIHPDDRHMAMERHKRRLAGNEVESIYQFRIVDKAGLVRWVEINGVLIQWENRPATLNFLSDVTKRMRAEEKLNLNLIAMEAANEGMAILDNNGSYLYLNEAHAHIFGYDLPKELLGKKWKILFHNDELRRFEEDVIPGFWRNGFWSGTMIGCRRDGSPVYVAISLTALDSGGLVSITRDITELKKAEEQQEELQEQLTKAERMESLGLLAGGVAHDLNNILAPLVGYPDLILADLPRDNQAIKRVERMRNSALEAVGIIQDLLTMARRGKYSMSPTSINDVVESYLDSPSFIELVEKHPHVKFEKKLQEKIPDILGSATHLSKVIMNLIVNAFDAMPDGGTLTVETTSAQRDSLISGYGKVKKADYLLVKVKDTGVGISKENMRKIFEPYFSGKKMGRSGSGLGLSVVYGITKDHKGYYDVFSEVNKGTEFILYFPVTTAKKKRPDKINNELSGNETVLIVDDREDHCEIAEHLLTSLGYDVHAVSNGKDALQYIAKIKADVLVLDMYLEENFDGWDTFNEIAKIYPNQKVVVVSGYSPNERVQKIQDLSGGLFVRKPFTRESLAGAIREVLDMRRTTAFLE